MPMAIVPDVTRFASISRNVADLKQRADVTREEAVTGAYQDVTKQLKGDVGSAHLLKKAVEDVQNYQQNLSLSQGRTSATQLALGNIGTDANRLGSETLLGLEQENPTLMQSLSDDARVVVSAMFSSLNASFGGRSLFGGDEPSGAPMGDPAQLIADVEAILAGATDTADAEAQLDIYFNDPAGGFATNIYQGGANDAPAVELSPGIRINASIRADAQPLKDALRGIAVMAAIGSAGFADRNVLIENNALATLEAEGSVIDMRAALGVSEARISDTISAYETEETILSGLYADKTSRDAFEAASELQILETQLEAAYLMTSRLSRLTLSNYLR